MRCLAQLVEVGAARRSGPGTGNPADTGGAARREIAATILNEDTRHDGGWTLPRLSAEIARRGGPAISPDWLSQQLRQRGLPIGGRVIRAKPAR